MVRKSKKKKKNDKKNKHIPGKKEFIFNFLSLIILIGIGIYFGYRSLYYYSRQNIKISEEAQTLNGTIISHNELVQENNDGLHRDNDGYYFKGNVLNNYVLFSNRLFRVIRINNDNTVKMVSENLVGTFMFGEKKSYKNSNIRNWLTNTKNENSGVYYNSLPAPDIFLAKTSYSEDLLKDGVIKYSDDVSKDSVSTLTIHDYILANGKSSYLNNGKIFFLLGLDGSSNLYIDDDGSIQSCDSLDGYGVRAVITLKSNTLISSGDGSLLNPYHIEQDSNRNYVDSYVRLGNDVWKVFNDKDGVLKLYLNGYINNKGIEYFRNYGTDTSLYDLTDKKSLAYYLNNTYLTSLPYSSLLLDTNFYIGEVSDDTGYSYGNIYKDIVTCKIGLLNIFDYVSNNDLDDYFHINTTSSVGSIQYSVMSNGLLVESSISEEKHIVPVISISSEIIKGGSGLVDDPYVVE